MFLVMNFRFEDLPVFIPLPPEDLRFFYYDVVKYGEKEQLLECSNEELVEFANEFGIKLTPIQQQTFSVNKYKPAENEIIFTFIKGRNKKEMSYQNALFKHLRNSFAHYRISYKNNGEKFVLMEDGLCGGYTMKGLVEIEKLKSLVFKLERYNEEQLLNIK